MILLAQSGGFVLNQSGHVEPISPSYTHYENELRVYDGISAREAWR